MLVKLLAAAGTLLLMGYTGANEFEKSHRTDAPRPLAVKTVLPFELSGKTKIPVRIDREADSFELILFIANTEINRISLFEWMDRAKFLAKLEGLSDATAE